MLTMTFRQHMLTEARLLLSLPAQSSRHPARELPLQ
jgi:hypothetical protein